MHLVVFRRQGAKPSRPQTSRDPALRKTTRMNRIESHFSRAAAEGRKSLILFLTAGFPNLDVTEQIIPAIDKAGADILELGVPFSDPLADGPTIQAASAKALEAGTTLAKILDLVARVRVHSQIPILLFGAFNPFLHFGLEALARRALEVGVDGFLVPDLPSEESDEFDAICRKSGLSLIYLVAPTTPPERMKMIAKRSTGFIYYISLMGVTGTAINISPELREHVETLRRFSAPLPVAVGFGVQTPDHVRGLASIGDAVIVGSALIRLIDQYKDKPDLLEQVGNFTRALKSAL